MKPAELFVRAYLLDVNHVAAWEKADPRFVARLRKVPAENLPRVSAITLGEIEAGMAMTSATDDERRQKYRRFVIDEVLRFAYIEPVTEGTRHTYAEVMGAIWKAHPPPHSGISTDAHLVNTLGVSVNDVWLVAVALEHNMTLLTTDRMKSIRAVTAVRCENWLE